MYFSHEFETHMLDVLPVVEWALDDLFLAGPGRIPYRYQYLCNLHGRLFIESDM